MSVVKNGLLRKGWRLLASLVRSGRKMYIPSRSTSRNEPNSQACGGGDTVHMSEEDFEKKSELVLSVLKQVGKIEGRTRFQKMIFLGQQELGLRKSFDFSRHYYGPYSPDLADVIETLMLHGDVIEEKEQLGDYIKYSYSLSRSEEVGISDRYITDEQSLETLKKLSRTRLDLILAYVYKKYCPKQGQMEISA